MSAAPAIATSVATVKIVLRIMGLAPAFLGCVRTSCPAVGRTIHPVQRCKDKSWTDNRTDSRPARAGPATSSAAEPGPGNIALQSQLPHYGTLAISRRDLPVLLSLRTKQWQSNALFQSLNPMPPRAI